MSDNETGEAEIREAYRRILADKERFEAEAAKRGVNLHAGEGEQVDHVNIGQGGQDALDGLLGTFSGEPAKPLLKVLTLPDFELGPGLVTVLGAPPAAGKTLLAMQTLFEAVEFDESLTAYVLNCEMTPQSLLRRELARLTGIPARALRFGTLTDTCRELIHSHSENLRQRLERVRFVNADAEGLAVVAKAGPGLVVIDYLQRFSVGKESDPRRAMNEVMTFCRRLADHGHSVLVISATKRSTEGKHANNELSLSSFRESGEIEYGADAAYVLKTSPPNDKGYRPTSLVCVKNRNGESVSIELMLDTNSLSFYPASEVNEFMEITSGGNPFGGDDDEQ